MNLLGSELSSGDLNQLLLGIETAPLVALAVLSILKLRAEKVLSVPLARSLQLPIAILIFLISLIWNLQDLPVSLFPFIFCLSAVLALSVFDPAIALGNVLALLILRPWEIVGVESGFLLALPRLMFVLVLVSTSFLIRIPLRFRKPTLDEALVFGFGLWVLLSTYITGDPAQAQAEFAEGFAKPLVVFFLVRWISNRSKPAHETATLAAMIGVAGLAFVALANTSLAPTEDGRLIAKGSLENANDLAAILILAMPLVFLPVFRNIRTLWWIVALPLTAVALVGVEQAKSRAAWIAVVVMIAGAIFIRATRGWSKQLLRGAVAGAVVLLLLAGVALSQLSLGRGGSDLEESRTNRVAYWKAGFAMGIRNPVLGVGFNQYPRNYSRYGQSGFTESGDRTAHSSWILAFAETGLIGFGLFMSLFLLAIRRAWQIRFEAPEICLSLLGYLVVMSFLSHTYTLYPFILLGLVFGYPSREREV